MQWSFKWIFILAKSRKCLLLDNNASGHPTTGQNILLEPELLLLCPLTVEAGLDAVGVDTAPEGAVVTLECWAAGVEMAAPSFDTTLLAPGITTEGLVTNGTVGRPSWSMSSGGGKVSILFESLPKY